MRPGRVVIGIPSGVTEVERRAVADAALQTGASVVNLVDEPMAAAIGAGMPVDKPTGSMIIDIGGGTTEIAVVSLKGCVVSKSLRTAGDELNENIQDHLKKTHNLSIGERTAEEIKIRMGSAYRNQEEEEMEVRGLNLLNGLPHTITINSTEVRECLFPTLMEIVAGVKNTLEMTPPELAADIVDRGIVLAGGGALLAGMDELIAKEVDVPVHIANDPLSCVVLGTEKMLNDPTYQSILDATEFRG
jgi:rod shape-determining protein MreB